MYFTSKITNGDNTSTIMVINNNSIFIITQISVHYMIYMKQQCIIFEQRFRRNVHIQLYSIFTNHIFAKQLYE